MSKVDEYRETLGKLGDWDDYLRAESGLPGPRGNLELAHAAADLGDRERFEHFLSFDPQRAPVNTPDGFLAFCGVEGLGRMIAEGQTDLWPTLRAYASDPRWRIREAVATGLQLAGDQDMQLLLKEMKKWSKGSWYEKRAAAAALAEPRLLKDGKQVEQVLQILDQITASMQKADPPNDAAFKVLRQGMGYCWSVAVAALPEAGQPMLEKWLESPSKDVRWMMKENLKKNRLIRMDANWVKACTARMEQQH